MNIHEHQAKQILKKFGANVPDGVFALSVDELVNSPNVVPASFKKMSPPSASNTISVVASSVIVEPESISAITGVVKVLFVHVSDNASVATVAVVVGNVTVALPEKAECAGA